MSDPRARHPHPHPDPVIAWLLGSDPAIRWQALRDLAGAPAEEIAAERSKVAKSGLGAQLLAAQAPDGSWAGAAWNPGSDSTMHVLQLLWQMGLDPEADEARRAIGWVREHVTWRGCGPPEADGNGYFEGETEPCINGQVAAAGAYFGQDVTGVIERLLGEQLADGGWNCEAENGSTRSSFHTTICVLEALLEHERAGPPLPEVSAARLRGQAYLLDRGLLRRRSTGELIDLAFSRLAFPTWWHFDVLRGLDYLRSAAVVPDARLADAVELVRSKRGVDGRWRVETQHPGRNPTGFDDAVGTPSPWITLRALRVLAWYSAAA